MTSCPSAAHSDQPARSGLPPAVWVACLIALVLRLAAVQFYYGWNRPLRQDEPDYDAIATNLAAGRGFAVFPGQPSAWRPPAYPAFLAAIYKLAGRDFAVVRFVQCLIGAATCGLVFLLGKHMADRTVGLVSAYIAALYPLFIALNGRLYTETVYLPLVLLAALALARLQRDGLRWAALLGAVCGLSALVRPNLALFPLLAGLGLLMAGRPLQRVLLETGLMLAVTTATILPWAVRNYLALGAFVPISTNGGITLFVGNNPWAVGGGAVEWAIVGYPPEEAQEKFGQLRVAAPRGDFPSGINFWQGLSEVENDRRYTDLAKRWIRANPGRFLALMPKKLLKLFSWRITSGQADVRRSEWLSLISYGAMLPFSVLGLILSLRDWRPWLPAYLFPLPFIVSACLFYGSARLRQPVDPFLIVFAGFALCSIYRWQQRRSGALSTCKAECCADSEGGVS